MWIAVLIVFFMTPDGRLAEREFRTNPEFQTKQECLQSAGRVVIESIEADTTLTGYAVTCVQAPTA